MKKLIILLSLIVATFMVVNLTSETEVNSSTDAPVGEQAPEFEVMGADGNMYSLSDFEGQYVILEWLNHGCPYIRKHYDGNNMQQLQEKYTDKENVVWLSVISSAPGEQGYMEPDEAQQSIEEYNASPTAILLDPEGEMGRAYNARVTPHMFIIDPSGTVRYNGAIDDKPTPRASSLETAHNYIDAAMNSLMNGEEVAVKSNTPYGCGVKYDA